jgi:hypothetical protein
VKWTGGAQGVSTDAVAVQVPPVIRPVADHRTLAYRRLARKEAL